MEAHAFLFHKDLKENFPTSSIAQHNNHRECISIFQILTNFVEIVPIATRNSHPEYDRIMIKNAT
jgi:hypothetical protein